MAETEKRITGGPDVSGRPRQFWELARSSSGSGTWEVNRAIFEDGWYGDWVLVRLATVHAVSKTRETTIALFRKQFPHETLYEIDQESFFCSNIRNRSLARCYVCMKEVPD